MITVFLKRGMDLMERDIYYKISKEKLIELFTAYEMLCALENGGVDDWEWYSCTINDYLNSYKMNSFEEFAEAEIKNLPIVTDDFKYIDEAHLHIILYLLLSNTAISIIKYFTSNMEKNLALENFNKLIEILKFGILKGEPK